jgi:sulfur carrier protein ThiS
MLCYKFEMKVEWEGKVAEVDKRLTVDKLLELYSLSREAHLVIANGSLVTEDRMLGGDDRVKIVRVISGG